MSLFQVFNVVFLGESEVGKTCIFKNINNEKLSKDSIQSSTFNIREIEIKISPEKTIRMKLFDIPCNEDFRFLADCYLKEANAVYLVYDVTKKKSFNEMKEFWYEKVKNNCKEDIIVAVVANKSDLSDERLVRDRDGIAFAKENNAIFVSTTALNENSSIQGLYLNLAKKLDDPNFDFWKDFKEIKSHNFIIREIQEDNMAHESNTNSRFDRDYEREQNRNERHEASEIKSETEKSEGKTSFCC